MDGGRIIRSSGPLWATTDPSSGRGRGGQEKKRREAFTDTLNTQILVAFHHLAQHQASCTRQPTPSTGSAHLWCTSTHPVEPGCTPWQSHCGTQARSHHLHTVNPVLCTLSAPSDCFPIHPEGLGVGGTRSLRSTGRSCTPSIRSHTSSLFGPLHRHLRVPPFLRPHLRCAAPARVGPESRLRLWEANPPLK